MNQTAKQLFVELGKIASKKEKVTINLRVQKDSAFMWKGAAIHPLQVLENAYQRIVRRSINNTGTDTDRREVEFEKLGQFFIFDDGEPTFFDSVKNARRDADKVESFENVPSIEDFFHQYFESLPGMTPEIYRQFFENVPSIEDFYRQYFQNLPGSPDVEDFFRKYYETLSRLGNFPQEEYLASVKMNHVIGTFYLFRLLVNYEIEATDEIIDEQRASVSGTLTSLLHNDKTYMDWLSEWLTEKVSQLGDAIQSLNPEGDKVLFFLKGGRALKYFLGKPEEGENDWDTQILINPNLSTDDWYMLFTEVHDCMLGKLREFKAEFSALVDQHKKEFENYIEAIEKSMPPPVVEDEEDDEYDEEGSRTEYDDDLLRAIFREAELIYNRIGEQLFPVAADRNRSHIASCKAELIDIGIPRRDTPAALEEWSHLQGKLLGKRLKYPGHHYYLNEYLMMVREAFTEHADVRKAPKRIQRLSEILAMDSLAAVIEEERNSIHALLPKIATAATARGELSSRLFTIMMTQFVDAYDLREDINLVPLFDSTLGSVMSDISESVRFPEELTKAINNYSNWKPQSETVGKDGGFGHLVSERMTKHFQDRAAFIKDHRKKFTSFIREVYEGVFRIDEELEVQFAIVGSFAAQLHAEYGRFDKDHIVADLEPVRRIDIKLYSLPETKPDIVLELVQPRIAELLKRDGSPFELKSGEGPSLLLYWRNEVAIGDFSYKPLVMKVSVQREENNPQLAFIWGLPVLDLRYLVTEYRRRSAEIEEYGARQVLNSATAAVADMLSRFEP